MRSLSIATAGLFLAAAPVGAADLCIVPSSNGVNATWECLLETHPWDHEIRGYSESSLPCLLGNPCTPDGGGGPFGWYISSSPTSSTENFGPLPPVTSLYLWLTCTQYDGLLAAEFGLAGSLTVLAYHPILGVNAGTATDLLLDFGLACPVGEHLVGEIVVTSDPTAVDGHSWGRIRSWYR